MSFFGKGLLGSNIPHLARRTLAPQAAPYSTRNFFTQGSALAKSRHAFASEMRMPFVRSSRSYQYDSFGRQQGVNWRAVGLGFGGAAVAALGTNYLLNGKSLIGAQMMPSFEAAYLNDTFKWMAGGLVLTAGSATAAFMSPAVMRFMFERQWVFILGSAAVCIGSMFGVRATHPEAPAHYFFWSAFNMFEGLSLAPFFFFSPAILARAGLYTIAALGGISYVGATAESDKYLWLGGPLLGGLFVLIATSLTPLIFPRFAMRNINAIENISIYGGIGIFSAMILYDTQKVRKHAHFVQSGYALRDPPAESISLILDVINLFTRIVMLLARNEQRRR